MDEYGQMAGWLGILTGDGEEALDAVSRKQVGDSRAGGSDRVIKAPGQLGSSICDSAQIRAQMEELGFEWLDEPSTDRQELLTQYIRLRMPEGWTLQRGSDYRQQYIHDERGVRRVSLYDAGQFWDPYVCTQLLSVGYSVSVRLVYGRHPELGEVLWDGSSTPEQREALCAHLIEEVRWEALTTDERTQVLAALRQKADEGARFPDLHPETNARIADWIERLSKDAA